MSFLFGGSKVPQMQTIQAPDVSKQAQADIAGDEKKKILKGRTSRSTLLTGPRGLTDPAPVQRKQLLGE